MSAVAGELADSKARMGILPLGTLNHFARDLGIPPTCRKLPWSSPPAKARAVDIAEVNGRTFVNNASIGLYPLMVMDRDAQRQRLGRSKRLAMLVASLRTMARFHSRRLSLSTDGGEARVDTPLLFVGNNDYRLALPSAGSRETLDDGELCVMVMRIEIAARFPCRHRPGASRHRPRRRHGPHRRRPGTGSRQRPRSHLTLAMDGETLSLPPPLTFRIRPRRCR